MRQHPISQNMHLISRICDLFCVFILINISVNYVFNFWIFSGFYFYSLNKILIHFSFWYFYQLTFLILSSSLIVNDNTLLILLFSGVSKLSKIVWRKYFLIFVKVTYKELINYLMVNMCICAEVCVKKSEFWSHI